MSLKQWTVEDSMWWKNLPEFDKIRITKLVLNVTKPDLSSAQVIMRLEKL